MNTRLAVGLIVALGGGATAPAVAQLNAELLALYGGAYATDCANPQSPRLRVERDALHVEQGDRRLSARRDVMAIHAYFGQSAPANFLVALDGQVRPQMGMTFLVFSDARGPYATLDGHPTVLANLGGLAKARFNRCDTAANQRAAANAPQDQQAAAAARQPLPVGQATRPHELNRDRRFQSAWAQALGPLARETWLQRMDGPAPDLRRERLQGQDWLVAAFCKPRDCGDHNAVLVYDEASGRVHGLLQRRGQLSLLGRPPAPLAGDLQQLWRQEWRQGR